MIEDGLQSAGVSMRAGERGCDRGGRREMYSRWPPRFQPSTIHLSFNGDGGSAATLRLPSAVPQRSGRVLSSGRFSLSPTLEAPGVR